MINEFLNNWDSTYKSNLEKIKLFNSNWTNSWNEKQIEGFIKVFYHLRGHFHEFLWFMANHAEDKVTKDIIIKNIAEEFNGSAASHEQMYLIFSIQHNISLYGENAYKKYYIELARNFNDGHMIWLSKSSGDERFAAFSAYERLDNTDYNKLLDLAKSIGTKGKGLAFFKVHAEVAHFETTEEQLNLIWEEDKTKVKNGFDFIASHQLSMWQALSDYIENLV